MRILGLRWKSAYIRIERMHEHALCASMVIHWTVGDHSVELERT